MAKKQEAQTELVDVILGNGSTVKIEARVLDTPEAEVVDALNGPAFVEETINLDIDLLVAALNTIVGGFKDLKNLFNPADSKGDAFVNKIVLLENQVEGLVAALTDVAVEDAE